MLTKEVREPFVRYQGKTSRFIMPNRSNNAAIHCAVALLKLVCAKDLSGSWERRKYVLSGKKRANSGTPRSRQHCTEQYGLHTVTRVIATCFYYNYRAPHHLPQQPPADNKRLTKNNTLCLSDTLNRRLSPPTTPFGAFYCKLQGEGASTCSSIIRNAL